MDLKKTKRTTVKQRSDRASYDKEIITQIIDEAIIGHLAFVDDKNTHSIPMVFWQDGDYLYAHSSIKGRIANLATDKIDVCISFTIMDGLVFAKSAFAHSVNYRSVVVYGQFELVEENAHKINAMKKLMDLFDAKRWDQVRAPDPQELKATAILKMPLEEAVAKIRKGPPVDKKSDLEREVWAGVIPYHHSYGEPESY